MAGGTLSPALDFIAPRLAGQVLGASGNIVARGLAMTANRASPNQAPGISDLLSAHFRGQLPRPDLVRALRQCNGVALDPANLDASLSPLWRAVYESNKPVPTPELAAEMFRRGNITSNEYDEIQKRNGLDDPYWRSYLQYRTDWIGVGDIIRLHRQGAIDRARAKVLMNDGGLTRPSFQDLLLDDTIGLAPAEILVALNRKLIERPDAVKFLEMVGVVLPANQDLFIKLAQQIPGPADLVRFAVREVWDPAVVQRWGYDEDFPVEFKFWLDRQGLDWSEDVPGPNGNIPGVPWPKAYWRAHWQNMSPTQAYQCLFRLRANRIQQYQAQFPDIREFTVADLKTILKISDYPKGQRDALGAISYRIPTRGDLQNQWGLQIISDQAELKEKIKDLGYQDADAENIKQEIVLSDVMKRTAKLQRQAVGKIERAYRSGILDQDQAGYQLHILYLREQGLIDAFLAEPLGTRLDTVNNNKYVQSFLALIDIDWANTLTVEGIRAIRKAFLRWELTMPQAEAALLNIGINLSRVQGYTRRWTIARYGTGKTFTASQLLSYVKRGIISVAQATVRLGNLGYNPNDIGNMLAGVQLDLAQAAAKAQVAAARTAAQRQRAALAALRAQQTATRAAQRALASHSSPAKMAKWYSKGLITRTQALSRLAFLDWTPDDAARLLDDALLSRGTPPSPSGPPHT